MEFALHQEHDPGNMTARYMPKREVGQLELRLLRWKAAAPAESVMLLDS